MFVKLAILSATCIIITLADADDKKWVWSENGRSGGKSAPSFDNKAARYEVLEDEDVPYGGQRPPLGGYNDRPINFNPNRPNGANFGPQGGRPGGSYGSFGNGGGYESFGGGNAGFGGGFQNNRPIYGGNSQSHGNDGILTGPVPSWVKEGPIKDFDRCKCTEKFNCNSPGFSYGHCDVGKQYCCYSTKKHNPGGPIPSRPNHSLENGILVGPNGPSDYPSHGDGGNRYPRPGSFPGSIGGNFGRPVNRPYGNGNIHSPENGILVGPGGPYDRPSYNRPGGGGYARSSSKKE